MSELIFSILLLTVFFWLVLSVSIWMLDDKPPRAPKPTRRLTHLDPTMLNPVVKGRTLTRVDPAMMHSVEKPPVRPWLQSVQPTHVRGTAATAKSARLAHTQHKAIQP